MESTGCLRRRRILRPGFRKWKIAHWPRSCCREWAKTRRGAPSTVADRRTPAAGDRTPKSGNGVMLSYFLDRLLRPHFLLILFPHRRCYNGSSDCCCTWARMRCPMRCGSRRPCPGRWPAGCATIAPSIPFLWFDCSSGSSCVSLFSPADSFVVSKVARARIPCAPIGWCPHVLIRSGGYWLLLRDSSNC